MFCCSEDRHVKDINRNNPLGHKGKLAESYASLVKEIYSNKYTEVAPEAFKVFLRIVLKLIVVMIASTLYRLRLESSPHNLQG